MALDQNKELRAKLTKAVVSWAKELPQHLEVYPDAIFVEPKSPKEDQVNDLPALRRLRTTLADSQIPRKEQWVDAICEKRRVVASVNPPQMLTGFFTADEAEVYPHINSLAEQLFQICQQNEKLFQATIDEGVQRLLKGLGDIKQLLDERADKQKLALLESHLIASLGIEDIGSLPELAKARAERLHSFVESFDQILLDRDPLARIIVEHARALGLNPYDATQSSIKKLLGIESVVESHQWKAAIVGGAFDAEDPLIEFVYQGAARIDSSWGAYTRKTVSALRIISPNSKIVVLCPEIKNGATDSFCLVETLGLVLSTIDVAVVLIPLRKLGQSLILRHILGRIADNEIIPVLHSWDLENDSLDAEVSNEALREAGCIFAGEMAFGNLEFGRRPRDLAFPDTLPKKKDDGAVELLTGFASAFACGFVLEAIGSLAHLKRRRVVEQVYAVARSRSGIWSIPSMETVRSVCFRLTS